MTTIRIGLVLLFVFFPGATQHIYGQGGEPAPSPVGSGLRPTPASEAPFRKGAVEVSVIGGAALPISLFRARADRRLAMASFHIGRVMTNQIGHGALAGHFELLLEMTPLVVLRQPESVFGLAVSPVFLRWNFAPSARHRLRLFAEASGGMLYTNQAVPVRTTVFNFIDQAGFGLRFEHRPDRAWLMGYRFQHVSNGGRIRPNPGANFNFVYGGVTWLR